MYTSPEVWGRDRPDRDQLHPTHRVRFPRFLQLNRGSTFSLRCLTLGFCHGEQRSYMERELNQNLSGHEVYNTNSFIFLVKNTAKILSYFS